MSLILSLPVLVLTLSNLAWWVWADRSARRGRHARQWRIGVALVAMTALALLYAIIASWGREGPSLPRWLFSAGLVWHLMGLPLALIIGLCRGGAGAAAFLTRHIRWRQARSCRSAEQSNDNTATGATGLSRREFLARGVALAPAVFVSAVTIRSQSQLNDFRIRHLDLPIRDLPPGLDGLVIAHVSDTHLGQLTTADTFRKFVAATNDFNADLVLHTGDLINNDQALLPEAGDLLRAFRSRYGTFICEGNHDLIEGRNSFRALMRKQRLPILIDETVVLRINGVDVELMGLGWPSSGPSVHGDEAVRAGVDELATQRRRNAFGILLAHHPHAFDGAIANGIPLTLAGHTHGGQLNLSQDVGFGPALYRYWSGAYERGGRTCVVSNGAGNWFPLRVNAPAEIARLTLRRA